MALTTMELTEHSVRGRWPRVDAYLEQLDHELSTATSGVRARTLDAVEQVVRESLWGDSDEEDAPRVHAALDELGMPAEMAEQVLQGKAPVAVNHEVLPRLPDHSAHHRRAWRAVACALGGLATFWMFPVALPLAIVGFVMGMWGLSRRPGRGFGVDLLAVGVACAALFLSAMAGAHGLGTAFAQLGGSLPPPPSEMTYTPETVFKNIPQPYIERDDQHGQ